MAPGTLIRVGKDVIIMLLKINTAMELAQNDALRLMAPDHKCDQEPIFIFVLLYEEGVECVNEWIGVRLTGASFSCVVWLPCCDDEPSIVRLNALLQDVVEAIRRVDPEMLDEIRVSEPLLWPSTS